jgi:hypothetical protein
MEAGGCGVAVSTVVDDEPGQSSSVSELSDSKEEAF